MTRSFSKTIISVIDLFERRGSDVGGGGEPLVFAAEGGQHGVLRGNFSPRLGHPGASGRGRSPCV